METSSRILLAKRHLWSAYLHENQCYLGRCYIWAERVSAIDLIDTTEEEREELFALMSSIRAAVKRCFLPDLFNYASLGNVNSHLHVHVIPRYSSAKSFGGVTFQDKRWGKNYSPYDKEFHVPRETLVEIGDAIRYEL